METAVEEVDFYQQASLVVGLLEEWEPHRPLAGQRSVVLFVFCPQAGSEA